MKKIARLMNAFLETVYLEWADRESPAVGGETPRHVMTTQSGRTQVAALIDEMERNDFGKPSERCHGLRLQQAPRSRGALLTK
jgi:hypothetical protein